MGLKKSLLANSALQAVDIEELRCDKQVVRKVDQLVDNGIIPV